MKLQIYISDLFSKHYLPFMLYRNCICNILKNNNILENIDFIYDINHIDNNENNIILMNFYCILYTVNYDVYEILKNNKSKVILINTEFYQYFNIQKYINNIYNDKLDYYIFEYNIINYRYFNEKYPNLKLYFIPQIYNNYLETYYLNQIENIEQINKNENNIKDIDIFFYGKMNDRRSNILDILKQKYNIVIISYRSDEIVNKEICNVIKRSKIVLNILHDDYNSIFDYYRNSFLVSNKVLLISEKPQNIDTNLEIYLRDIDSNLIIPEYNKMIETVEYYLNNYNEEFINNLIDKQYKWFKKYNLKDLIINAFDEIKST
jgi:hypothetical protein